MTTQTTNATSLHARCTLNHSNEGCILIKNQIHALDTRYSAKVSKKGFTTENFKDAVQDTVVRKSISNCEIFMKIGQQVLIDTEYLFEPLIAHRRFYKLNEFPKEITIYNTPLTLVRVIEYITAHYVAYCFDGTRGTWHKDDDLVS